MNLLVRKGALSAVPMHNVLAQVFPQPKTALEITRVSRDGQDAEIWSSKPEPWMVRRLSSFQQHELECKICMEYEIQGLTQHL